MSIKFSMAAAVLALTLVSCGGNAQMARQMDSLDQEKFMTSKFEVNQVTTSVDNMPEHFLAAVKGHLKNELRSRGLLKASDVSNSNLIDVDVTYYRMRSGMSRMFLGMLAGKDGIEGKVTIHEAGSNHAIAEMTASSYNLMAIGESDDIARMFAEQVAKTIEKNQTLPSKGKKLVQHD